MLDVADTSIDCPMHQSILDAHVARGGMLFHSCDGRTKVIAPRGAP
jgi:hypothetical protein